MILKDNCCQPNTLTLNTASVLKVHNGWNLRISGRGNDEQCKTIFQCKTQSEMIINFIS